MNPNDIVISLRVKNEPIDDWLNYHSKFCRGFIIIDDRSERDFNFKRNDILFYAYKNSLCEFNELSDYEIIINAATHYNLAKYVLCLDCDEYLDNYFLEEMQNIPDCIGIIRFKHLYMYPDEHNYIINKVYKPRYIDHMYKVLPDQTYLSPQYPDQSIFGPSRVPMYNKSKDWFSWSLNWQYYYSKSIIKHYNMCESRRQKRYEFYTSLQPGSNYEHILDTYEYANADNIRTTDDIFDYRIKFPQQEHEELNPIVAPLPNKKLKIVNAGFHKTGLMSVDVAFNRLKINKCPPAHKLFGSRFWESSPPWSHIDRFVFFQDFPWALMYRYFDKMYENVKFILTIRDPENWYQSVVNNFGHSSRNFLALNLSLQIEIKRIMTWIYGKDNPEGNKQNYIDRYNRHNENVLNYFKNRPDDLLILDIFSGDGWEKLCNFLKVPIVNDKFPVGE